MKIGSLYKHKDGRDLGIEPFEIIRISQGDPLIKYFMWNLHSLRVAGKALFLGTEKGVIKEEDWEELDRDEDGELKIN